ncbi:MAG TPA: hypothetical protein PLS08_06765 [Chryseolinea sp.]|nr:hypothetical protein [Chryseolinea sp.]
MKFKVKNYLYQYSFAFAVLMLLSTTGSSQTKIQQKIPEKTRILFLFDGSGSMLEPWGQLQVRNQTKISVAKSILSKLIDSLRQNSNLELALRIYGHRSPRELNNCKDTNLEVPFKSKNHDAIIDKLKEIKPKGVTQLPIRLSKPPMIFQQVLAIEIL